MLSKYNSKKKFSEIIKNSHYLRVDEQHPLELQIGLNDEGHKTIRFIGNFKRVKVKGTKAINVNHYLYRDKIIISFSLCDTKYIDLFYIFCNDLIDTSRSVEQIDGYVFLVNRFEKWRGFGSQEYKYLSEGEIKGLIGELLFLKEVLINKYGESKSVLGWTGPEPTKKDFSYDDVWYEVKATTRNLISISSLEQLDSDINGYLIVYHFEKVSPEANGYTLNNVFDSILESFTIESYKTLFVLKILETGYIRGEYYDSYVYRINSVEYFEVTNEFPRIKKILLPNAISNVKYDIIVSMLEDFRRDGI